MFLATLGVSVLLGRIGRGRVFLVVPAAIATIAAGSRILLGFGVGWIYPALWLLRGASEFLLGMAVWGLAGLVTDTRQAKRFFPLIGVPPSWGRFSAASPPVRSRGGSGRRT